jgi:uncharacterized protein YbjT (DUF2867 family)
MKILIIGGKGFIGRHIAQACQTQGHKVVLAVRKAAPDDIACDLQGDTTAEVWSQRLGTVDAVINCAGLLHGAADVMQAVHCDAPVAIAKACAQHSKPFLHISVLGLQRAADTPYFASKRAGEEAIRTANPATIIVRPSLVFGMDSPASTWLMLQARLPLLTLPRDTQPIAPVHVDDLAALCARLIGTMRALGADVDCVGTQTMTMETYLKALREAFVTRQRATSVTVLHLPNRLMRLGLATTGLAGAATLRAEALDLMEHAHVGNPHDFERWMHYKPRPVSSFVQRTKPVAEGFASG